MDADEQADVIEGFAVLTRALGTIGAHGKTDSDMAKVICEGELKLRALWRYTLSQLANSE